MKYVIVFCIAMLSVVNVNSQIEISTLTVGKFSIPSIESSSSNFDQINRVIKNDLLSFDNEIDIYSLSPKEVLNHYNSEWEKNRNGYSGLTYEIVYNSSELLSFKSTLSHMGAYPDDSFSFHVFDMNTQRKMDIESLFKPYGFGPIKKRIHNILSARITEAKNGIDGPQKEQTVKWIDELFDSATETFKYEFLVTEFGITFIVDYGFPHVIKVYEPDSDIFIPYDELSQYLLKSGPLGKYAK